MNPIENEASKHIMSMLKGGGVWLQSSGQANTRIVVIAGVEIFLPTVFEED